MHSLTGPLCLPATGLDGGSIALIAVLAVAIIAVGVIALRRNKAAAAFILVPLAVLALAFGGTATSAEAVQAKIPDFTVSTVWTPSGPDYVSNAPTAQQLTDLQTLEELSTTEADFTLTLFNAARTQGQSIPTVNASAAVGTGIAEVDAAAVDTAQDAIVPGFGDLPLEYTITFHYLDDCGNPLTTTVVWTGTVNFLAPVP